MHLRIYQDSFHALKSLISYAQPFHHDESKFIAINRNNHKFIGCKLNVRDKCSSYLTIDNSTQKIMMIMIA